MLPKNFTYEEKTGSPRYSMGLLKSDKNEEEIKIRFVTDFITGLSVWGPDDKNESKRVCHRYPEGVPVQTKHIGVNQFSGEPEMIKQFIAAVVYNYGTKQLEIFETDKSTIIGQIVDLESDTEDFGDVKNYDIKIKRTGFKMDTTYTVKGLSTKPPEEAVLRAIEDELSTINLEALYTNNDPFKAVDFVTEMDAFKERETIDIDDISL